MIKFQIIGCWSLEGISQKHKKKTPNSLELIEVMSVYIMISDLQVGINGGRSDE